jgi:hypothetical protein
LVLNEKIYIIHHMTNIQNYTINLENNAHTSYLFFYCFFVHYIKKNINKEYNNNNKNN